MEGKDNSSFMRLLVSFVVGAVLVFVTAITTLYITKTMHPAAICGGSQRLSFSAEDKWDAVENFNIPGKDITVSRTQTKCYLSPLQQKREDGKATPLQLVHDPLSEEMVEALGGPAAVEVCDGLPTYMLKVIIPEEEELKHRLKRATGSAAYGVRENPAQDISNYDDSKNDNRCMDVIVLCSERLNEKHGCWTGINGLFWMDVTCTKENEFVVQMTKPPGRLIKIIRNQWVICQKRRRKGLSRC